QRRRPRRDQVHLHAGDGEDARRRGRARGRKARRRGTLAGGEEGAKRRRAGGGGAGRPLLRTADLPRRRAPRRAGRKAHGRGERPGGRPGRKPDRGGSLKSVLKIALGIIAALGGFLDIGDIVFTTQAGALYRYDLLWAVVLGTVGIAVYAEMCGRVAAVTGRPVFDVIRMRMGFGLGLVSLLASTFVNVLTVAAELGGLAIILQLLF